ncbi:MAG: MerC family mercury resistance protein [Nannocystis sp.]|nr:MerC family mercury resistance protein [Nannocystis sp.]MBA3547115.1 MerC family mercury resistance protein [Nannocystis sp.]
MRPGSPSDTPRPGSARLDLLGVVASSTCLVHCLATPLIVVSLPFVADARFEGALAVILVVLAAVSALLALARRRRLPMLTCGLGLVALMACRALELPEGSPEERLLVVLAAALMIVTHLLSLATGRPHAAVAV